MKAEKISRWRIKGQLEVCGVIHPQGREYTLLEVAPLWSPDEIAAWFANRPTNHHDAVAKIKTA